MANGNWYQNCYRRNLVDMHIEDWNEEFLAKFDPEEYVANLKRAHIEAPMLYLQSHVGHCYWPTKTGHMHAALKGREDLMRRLVDLCHAEGMSVVGYYSLIHNTYEEDRHPEWRIQNAEGVSIRQRGNRHGLLCPNNPEHRAFVKAQIAEMAEYFDLDGMFYDMTYWQGICHCEHCKAKYRVATGRDEFPAVNWKDPAWLEFQRLRDEWMGDFARMTTEEIQRLVPGISVEHNYANAVASDHAMTSSTELVNDWCTYAGGDLYGDLYNHSFTAKYYYNTTQNQPFEYMTCRCDHDLSVHTVSKTEEHLAIEVMLTAAHHGASFIIDAIDPVGTLDSRVYERIGRVFERQLPYEQYFSGEMVQDAAVYYSTTGRYNTRGLYPTSKNCSIGAVRMCIEENIPVGVIGNRATALLDGYKLVLAPHIAGIFDNNRDDLVRYVKNGGVLYVSGAEDPALLRMLLGAELAGYTEEVSVYLAPTAAGEDIFAPFNAKYPFPTEASLPVLTGAEGEVLATMTMPYTKPSERRFASIHSNPPGIPTEIPALIARKLGEGTVIWSAAPIEIDRRRAHRRLLKAILARFVRMDALTIRSDAPRQVELVTFRRDADTLISAVDLLCTDELLPIRPFTVEIACDAPEKVIRIGGRDRADEEIPFTYAGGYAKFTVDDLVMFEMYRIV